MSEKIYAFLLRLHPSQFREAYAEEALQLFRDRSRDERGFLARVRLWLDLLADLAISVPRRYGHVQPDLIRQLDGIPSFRVLGGESPRQGALLFGGMLSLVTLAAFPVLISHFGKNQPDSISFFEPLHSAKPIDFQLRLILAESAFRPQTGTPRGPIRETFKLDAAEQQRVIQAVIANTKAHYIDAAAAQQITNALLGHEKNGDYDAVTDGAAFADLLTTQLRNVSHDMHFDVIFSQDPLPDHPGATTPETVARYRRAMEQVNCTFEKVEILPHNIGYLKFDAFPDPSVCRATAVAAMASLNHADAVIFDLRENGGGFPDMVMLISAYLFDHPEYMYNPRENTTERLWTHSPVPGNKLADKPVYVLTSARSISGAEQFSYDLKMLKRVTLVGETTAGAAHAGVFHRIDDHFGMGIRETRAINPFSKSDWQGTGVEPDIKVKAADALDTAKKLAESRLRQ